ncbi:MAG: glycosyltransferase family 2 protein [Patescibacteria group bacterium]|jgi:hypothetical protein
MNEPKVAIVYLSYHSDEYLPEMIEALKKSTYPKDKTALVIVDNPHPEFGSSIKKIEELVLPLSKNELPEVIILPQTVNKGFCGGNNVGIDWAVKNGFDYIFWHNQDGYVGETCIQKMVEALEADKTIGCAQALILLHGTTKINTAGNSFNYLGFGFIPNFGVEESSIKLPPVSEVGYASGAALMMRAGLVKQYGKLNEDLFAYHEDIEYSLRLKITGYKVVIVSTAKFFHKYVFNRSASKFYFLERNRYAVLLMYYKTGTLILLLPMLIFMELGLLVFFIYKGWFREKIKIYQYWLKVDNMKLWVKKREMIQVIRKITDRELLKLTTGNIKFGEKQGMDSPLLRYIANPLMIIYKRVVELLVFW